MIQKMSSKDIMDLLEESQNSIKDIELNVNDMKSELEKRLSIIENVQEYTQESIIDIKELLSDGLNDSVEILYCYHSKKMLKVFMINTALLFIQLLSKHLQTFLTLVP